MNKEVLTDAKRGPIKTEISLVREIWAEQRAPLVEAETLPSP